MRRRLVLLWIALVVIGLGVAAAPPAVAADPAPNQFLWVATSTQTLVYDRTTIPPTLVASRVNAPTGGFARATSVGQDVVYAATQSGIDAFDPQTGQYVFGFSANPSGYAQLAGLPDGSKLYALRTDRSVVDVFADNTQLIRSIQLPGPATYMSDARPPNGDVILLGSLFNPNANNYISASINTANDDLTFFNAGTTHVANGTVWKPDGSVAYVTTATQGSTTGAIGRFTPPNGLTFTPTAGYTPQQIAISPSGTRLYVPATEAGGSGGIRVLDAETLGQAGFLSYNVNTSLGIPAMAPDGKLYIPSGPDVSTGLVAIYDIRGAAFSPMAFDNIPALGVHTSAKVTAVQATGGANQKMYVGRVFDDPAVATVVDAAGNPVANQIVQWTVTPASAATLQGCFLCYARSGLDGTVSSPFIVAGPNPGPVTVVATPVEGAPGATAAEFPLTILPPAVPPSVTSLTAGDGQVVVAFSRGDGQGISPPTGFTVTATDVFTPANGGQIATGSGSPITVTGLTNGDTYTFTVTANTPEGDWTSAPSQRINAGVPASITGTPPSGTVGVPYHFSFTVTGAPAPTVTLLAGQLPDGLAFDARTATISGVPTTVGSTYLLFSADNGVGSSQDEFTLDINAAGSPGEPGEPPPTATTSPTSSAPVAGSGSTPSGTVAAVSSRPLASTGMPVGQLVGGAAVLLLLGASMLLFSRRRRTADR